MTFFLVNTGANTNDFRIIMQKVFSSTVLIIVYGFLCSAALLNSACTTLTKPAQLEQSLYATDRSITELMSLAVDLRQQKLIPDDAWPDVKTALKTASTNLDDAWLLYKTDIVSSVNSLDGINKTLATIKQRLLNYQTSQVK